MDKLNVLKNEVDGYLETSEIYNISYLYIDIAQLDRVIELKRTMGFKIYRIVQAATTCILVVE